MAWDTETSSESLSDGSELQRLRLWRAAVVDRTPGTPTDGEPRWHGGTSAEALADAIEREAADCTVWCYAHNLGFDLIVTRLPELLARRGWQLTQHALASDAPWAWMSRGRQHVRILDSFSIFPRPLHDIAASVGIRKPPLPAGTAPGDEWARRCEADVAILLAALVQTMDWWDGVDAGSWGSTGPGCGWAMFRHRFLRQRVLIAPDEDATEMERRAITGGRRQVARVGRLRDGLWCDVDFAHAHAAICASLPLPVRRLRRFESLPPDAPLLKSQSVGVLAECVVRTDSRRYPWRSRHGVIYPIGRWRTVLAGPEIAEALQRGEIESIGPGYTYLTTPMMAEWGRWILGVVDAPPADWPPVVSIAIKAWSRTVPGRWGTRTSAELYSLPDPRDEWLLEEAMLMPARRRAALLTLGRTMHVIARDIEGDNAFPAVLAWVQSYTRVFLSRLVDELGDAVVQANTDGALVDGYALIDPTDTAQRGAMEPKATTPATVQRWLDAHAARWSPLHVRVKHAATRVRIIGAQHVWLDDEPRLAGVPRRARRVADLRFESQVWPRLPQQLARGDRRGYVIERHTQSLDRVPVDGWQATDGSVEPIRVDIADDGSVYVCPPPPRAASGAAWLPADRQHPVLRATPSR